MDTADEAVADRLVGYLVDFALLSAAAFAIWLLFAVVAVVVRATTGSGTGTPGNASILETNAVGLLLGLTMWALVGAVVVGYFTAMDADGGTLGKRLREVVVVTEDGDPAGAKETAVRTAVLLAPLPVMALLQVFLSLVGFVLALGVMAGWLAVEAGALALADDNRRLGDRAAGTVVVKTARSVGQLTESPPGDAPTGGERPGDAPAGGSPAGGGAATRE